MRYDRRLMVDHKTDCHKLLAMTDSYGRPYNYVEYGPSFLSDISIAAVVDGHCFFPKIINSCVPQGSVLVLIIFLLIINDLLNLTQCPIHSYAGDITLHFSTSYKRRPTQQELSDSR